MSQALDPVPDITSARRPPSLPRSSSACSPRRRSSATSRNRSTCSARAGQRFVPVLAHRFARERLKALAQAEGMFVKEQPEVLFVCVHNAGRSQMAAGLVTLRSVGESTSVLRVATPAERSTRRLSRRWRSSGSTWAEAFPKPLTDEVVRAADVVITMGCGDACPIFPGKQLRGLGARRSRGSGPRDGTRASGTSSTRASRR